MAHGVTLLVSLENIGIYLFSLIAYDWGKYFIILQVNPPQAELIWVAYESDFLQFI